MKIAIYYSGCVRTLKHVVNDNIETIKNNIGECDIHTHYSFWDETDKPIDISDEWCVPVPDQYGIERREPGDVDNDGMLLEYKSQNCFFPVDSEEIIRSWFSESGSSFIDGEIESMHKSRDIIENSTFVKIPKLASQYYKIHRVAEKYSPDNYDLCIRIRGDVRIQDFPKRDDVKNLESYLFINKYLWPNGHSSLHMCNEMVWCSTSDIFLETCSSHLQNIENIQNDPSGETVTARHFFKLISNGIVKNCSFFDFKHNALKFSKG